MEAVSFCQHEAGGIKHAESVAGATNVTGKCFGGLVFRLDDDLDVPRHLHPLALRAIIAATISEAAWAAALITISTCTWATGAGACARRSIAARSTTTLTLSRAAGRTWTTGAITTAESTAISARRWAIAAASRRSATVSAISAEASFTRPMIFTLFKAADVHASSAATADG